VIKKFLNGDFGVARTFWYGSFCVIVVSQALFYGYAWVYLSALAEDAYVWLDIVGAAFTLFLAIYLLLVVWALWKASFAGPVPNGWGILSIILTFYIVIVVSHWVIIQIFPSVGTPRVWAERQVRAMNSLLPQDLGDGFILEYISTSEGDLTYYFRVGFSVEEVYRPEFETAISISTQLGQEACTELQGFFKGGIRRAVHEYSFTDDKIRSILAASECFDWLER